MRFLKKKICLKPDLSDESSDVDNSPLTKSDLCTSKMTTTSEGSVTSETQELILPLRKPRQQPPSADGESKNIVKNYGRALCNFASSDMGLKYLKKIILDDSWNSSKIPDFVEFIKSKKKSIGSIESLRKLLIEEKGDNSEVLNYKKVFKEVSIIFLKFFAVNWIYASKLRHKKSHLKYRFKVLRRVKNPEYFTYLRSQAQ